MILKYPARHARASAKLLRAANPAKISALSELRRATGVERISFHHSAGMLLRCHHLETVDGLALTSAAIASFEGQSSITSRKDAGRSDMPHVLGHMVPKRKAKLSRDEQFLIPDTEDMSDRMSEAEEKAAFINRVKQARLSTFDTQEPICEILGIPQGTYKQYETRTELPVKFIHKFCMATRVSHKWLLTGQGKGGPKTEGFIRHVPKAKRSPPATHGAGRASHGTKRA